MIASQEAVEVPSEGDTRQVNYVVTVMFEEYKLNLGMLPAGPLMPQLPQMSTVTLLRARQPLRLLRQQTMTQARRLMRSLNLYRQTHLSRDCRFFL